MTLVEHAQRELTLIGEDQDVIDWYGRVIAEFASFGHSGGSAMVTIPVLHELLQFHPLSPLTDDPAEWIDRTEISGGTPMWQSGRHPEAFSTDGGKTYYLLSEHTGDGMTPMHESTTAHRAGG
jgi:hypothetical protein